MRPLTGYGVYVPRHRLSRAAIRDSLGSGGSTGERVVASFDEDATTMGVEAARRALPAGARPGSILFATTSPPYLDKTNATAIHAALDLGHEGFAADLAGSPRSAVAAIRSAAATGGLAVLSDLRTGRPGSADEAGSADAAAALFFGDGEPLAEVVAQASATGEFLDRWRVPGESASRSWEERFGQDAYLPLIRDAVARALAGAGLEQADHVVVSCPHSRAASAAVREHAGRVAPDPPAIGYSGAADPGVQLAAVLDRAEPGQSVLLVVAADGCDAIVLRTCAGLTAGRPEPVRAQLNGHGRAINYATYLTWRGLLHREPPRRPEPERPAAPPTYRSEAWKFGFVGGRCEACGQVHVPPRRVCSRCGAVDRMERVGLAGRAGTVATYTVDRLAFSPAPPIIDAVVDFEGGGRYTLEVADAGPEEVDIGTPLELTFRKLYTVDGVHNYFWKVRPAHGV